MNTTHIAVDLAKAVFQIAVSHSPGRVAEDHRLSRARFRSFFLHRPPCHVLMEACGSAHHWGRELGTLGHQVSLLPASHVARYRIGNKTDRSDTRAILEAARNEKITPVPVKSLDQQAITALHRLRSGYLSSRTARINAVRGLLVEFGIPIPKGARTFLPHAHRALDHDLIPAFLRDALFRSFFLHRPPCHVLMEACGSAHHWGRELGTLGHEAKATGLKDQLQRLGDNIPTVQYLLTVPGIGILSATALFSTVGDIHRFRSGRSLANYLGLTPREASSGLRRRLGRISKRGDTYTRMLLVHGARSALLAAHRATELDQLQAWAIRTAKARGHNIATVALANRIARIAWRVWRDQRPFQRIPQVQDVPA
jgi:transposase